MSAISVSYQDNLIDALRDPLEAAAYLNAALEEDSTELFLLALRNVAQARGILSFEIDEHPHLSNLAALLDNLGLKLAVEVREPALAM